jgi:uncharacterized protein
VTFSPAPRPPPAAIAPWLAADRLHLILMPTERCNFRCVYCYETFEHGRMRPPIIRGLRRLLTGRAPTLRSLSIEWFGGEPLLALPVIEEIQGHALRLAADYPALRLSGSMTTNGSLLGRSVLGRLVGLGVTSFQISLDGLAAENDARRKRADGAGSFDRIWSNLLAARRSELAFQARLRVHVDRDNHASLPAFLEAVARAFGGDERFEVFLRPVGLLGGPNDDRLPVLAGAEARLVDDLRRRAVDLGLRSFVPGPGGVCYAAAANSFVVRSTGRIAKCTVAFQHPNNDVGQLHPDGTVTVDQARINGWVRGLFSGRAEELKCPMEGFAESPRTGGRLAIVGD